MFPWSSKVIVIVTIRIRISMVLIFPFQGLRGAQPDGLNAEYCVAVLNNIYKVGN